MSKQVLDDFKKVWLKQYIEQYKKGNRQEKRAIKDNLYKNTGMTEKEKDYIWEIIILHVLKNNE